MAIAEQIGYDATGRETPEKNDLPEIIKQYREFEQIGYCQYKKENKIFIINQGELVRRIDPHYYKSEFINNYYKIGKIPNKKLGELIYFSKETFSLAAQSDADTNKFFYIEIGGIDLKQVK